MKFIIIDYGAGNATNVKSALLKIGVSSMISSDAATWTNADALIFPGVGSFGAAMKNLGNKSEILKDLITKGKPFLGICLGMQLLMDASEESSGVQGLGIIPGKAKLFITSLPVPQMCWNKVKSLNSPLFDGLDEFYAYFVHSYYCDLSDSSYVSAKTEYGGITFASAFWRKNIYATQFHPEKSGVKGLQLLRNFITEVKK
ncbi:imidazole glycerol phosphate synthase subunit HisH [Candidatus Micrarchaeota archaeon]|nr:imidazole glycerol phosphate synthase subunit HisH [Candidatus Micrarchaeota archaeon]MBU1165589.1 imidazole glycerol phosphate synthase subunit HisH [Candidatus Micrarchaeota archaeon]MBU1887400.1 imidazole glycerol phosphate synthase subunit HisH [Candidatus Micrarchaeota archaeon]